MSHTDIHNCGHCGEPHTRGQAYCVNVAGRQLSMCCAGCAAVATLIAAIGATSDGSTRDGDRRTADR